MATIHPFTINIPEDNLQLLKQKLALTVFPEDFIDDEEPRARGAPLADIKRIADYWARQFDWRKAEAELNRLSQYTTAIEVDGFGTHSVHFVHQESSVPSAIPLLFIHGWPSGFFEVSRMLAQLADGEKSLPNFHVVAPSLVDFGFSSASQKKRFNIDQHAEACHKLMLALGYTEYVVQGGDIGNLTARFIALKYGPTHCKAHHITNAIPAEPTEAAHPDVYAQFKSSVPSAAELEGLARTRQFFTSGNGYFSLASTKPQTIGYSLADSPVGLLAWIYEKLHDWSDPTYVWTDNEVCIWVSIYWFSSAGPAASSRTFYAMEHRLPEKAFAAAQAYTNDVPLGVARFLNDIVLLPKLWNQTLGPVVYESEHEVGGHFAAWECPDAIVQDLRAMFGRGGVLYGCINGCTGYASSD